MSKLISLIEQTAFLLEKQKEAQKECAVIFNDLISATRGKLDQNKDDRESIEHLEQVYTLIQEQSEKLAEEAQVDIDFLSEQLQALHKIQEVKDQEKARELLSMLVDEEEELKDTESFKREINEEAQLSRQNLLAMVNDIKDAIKEGSAQDVALYLENLLEDGEDMNTNEEGDEDGWEFEEEGCDDCSCGMGEEGKKCVCKKEASAQSGCGSCKGCSGGGCGSGCGSKSVDIFAELKQYHDDSSDKTTH